MQLELISHARLIKQKSQYAVKHHWLPQFLQKYAQRSHIHVTMHRGVFQHAESKFAIRFALRLFQQYKLYARNLRSINISLLISMVFFFHLSS